ncbi:glycosyltransferase family A protein [Nocardioides terrisoli]|uniref:glycosyltransferase family A protein n=1 Tax=Nocardioides terrisoli TaxID=3388267 RepID=UPI00287B7665|nr:glycosyltransferase family A protein [Nocardioides marmorisolisilvae]
MTEQAVDVTAIMLAHAEGPMAGPAFHSLLDAVAHAREAGLIVETLVLLDNPDAATAEAFGAAERYGVRVEQVSYGDHPLVRNHAAAQVSRGYIAFLDGDDLWGENWLVEAHRLCETDPGRVIAHPEVNWYFDQSTYLYFLPDQTDPEFDVYSYIRVANPWDALCMAPVAAYQDIAHIKRSLAEGFAFDDWHWNMETLVAGYVHRVAPDTIHFKRRRAGSQFAAASANKSLPRATPIMDYEWLRQHEDSGRPHAVGDVRSAD